MGGGLTFRDYNNLKRVVIWPVGNSARIQRNYVPKSQCEGRVFCKRRFFVRRRGMPIANAIFHQLDEGDAMKKTNEKENVSIKNNSNIPQCTPRAQRIIRRMQSFGLFKKDTFGAMYNRATSCRDLEQAFRLVHDVYVEAGYIRPQPHGIRMRHFECAPNTATFTAKAPSHDTIGVMSVVMDSSDFGLPSDRIYKEEIDKIRRPGHSICEFSNQAILREFRKKGPSTELMRCACAYAYGMGVSDIVCSVSPNVVSFYQMMRFNRIGETKNYSAVLNDPVVLIHAPDIQNRGVEAAESKDSAYQFFMRFFFQDNPYFSRFHAWEILNQRMFNDEFGFAEVIAKCPEFILDSKYEAGLKKRLGSIYELARDAIALSRSRPQTVRVKTHATLQRRALLRPVPPRTNTAATPGGHRYASASPFRHRNERLAHDRVSSRSSAPPAEPLVADIASAK